MWDPGYKKVKNWTKGVRISQEIGYENRQIVRGRERVKNGERGRGRNGDEEREREMKGDGERKGDEEKERER